MNKIYLPRLFGTNQDTEGKLRPFSVLPKSEKTAIFVFFCNSVKGLEMILHDKRTVNATFLC